MDITNKEIMEKVVLVINYIEKDLNVTDLLTILTIFKCAAGAIDAIISVKMQEDIVKSIKERSNPPIVNNYPIKYRNGDN
jgi:hypothetical protein